MANFYQVLLVEDDPLIAKTLKMSLPHKGFEVLACGSYQKGLEAFQTSAFSIILLDINLPDGNGLELCKEFRKTNPDIPILMLTARVDETTAVQGFESGADDYIRKPYGVRELAARMLRLIRLSERGPGEKKSSGALQFGAIRIDLQKRMGWAGETRLSLGKREFDILTLLIKKSGDVVTRSDILNILGEETEIYDRTIDSHLSHLRRKIKEAGTTSIQITPVYGVGYRLEIL